MTSLVIVVVEVPLAVMVFFVAVAVIVPAGTLGFTTTAGPRPVTDGTPTVLARTL